ncbi:DUF5615 family PIN-like protein [Skermania piniformis]|uniref:DUF5615 family PIN-like protein n=1 Tax=Skermania pinensis TaxID=39122 RepID=A0ABX8S7Z1_9ACTN|nr:DUF5615 family PIN-like protein [Skermania piniformis]QXQ13934.1 DUF5615 family PIN-like protein [Skermania piniformis]
MGELLIEAGHDARHVRDVDPTGTPDEVVIEHAASHGLILISADTDFGTLLAHSHASGPSFVPIRRASGRRAYEQAQLLIENLPLVSEELEAGAIVVLGEDTIRIRRLPM